MTIPSALLSQIKELVYISGTDRDSDIQVLYTRELYKLLQEEGWLVETETIASANGTSIYSTQTRCSRVIALLYNSVLLRETSSHSVDAILAADWMGDAAGTPTFWWTNAIPPSLDALSAITPDNVILHPPPSSTQNIVAFEVCVPSSEDPTPTYLDAYLVYKVAAACIREFGEERDTEELRQFSTQTIDFYEGLAELWVSLLKERIL